MKNNTKAMERLQRVCSELAELQHELNESDVETTWLTLVQDTVSQTRITAMTLKQGLEWMQVAEDRHGLVPLLIAERLRLASQLNSEIAKDIEAGRIRTDQEGLSLYLLMTNRAMARIDLAFSGRKA